MGVGRSLCVKMQYFGALCTRVTKYIDSRDTCPSAPPYGYVCTTYGPTIQLLKASYKLSIISVRRLHAAVSNSINKRLRHNVEQASKQLHRLLPRSRRHVSLSCMLYKCEYSSFITSCCTLINRWPRVLPCSSIIIIWQRHHRPGLCSVYTPWLEQVCTDHMDFILTALPNRLSTDFHSILSPKHSP